jgi:hypothetical protein
MNIQDNIMINIVWFVAAFALGILAVYVTAPTPHVVLKFPSPYNAGKVTYQDKSGECYRYRAEAVKCGGEAKSQPIMEDFNC